MTAFIDPVSLATLILAAVTLGLVVVTYRLVHLTQTSVDLSVRPLLADPSARPDATQKERLVFGAPGRITPEVAFGQFFYRRSDSTVTHFSLALENLGAGVAAIKGARTEPHFGGSVHISRKFVPVGCMVRVNVPVGLPPSEQERFDERWWAMRGIVVVVEYSDSNGRQEMVTKATIRQYTTQGPFVQEIAVFRKGGRTPIAVGTASY